MISQLISRLMILCFGTLYPAYRSYKAVKTKDVREYVKWMMYWIVFAFFTAVENAADLFVSWLPLYYELKILFLIWLLSPATKGSSILYRRFVHPWLARHEKDIDKYIDNAKQNGYVALLRVGRQGLNVATDTFLKTAATVGTWFLEEGVKLFEACEELILYSCKNLPTCIDLQDDASTSMGQTTLINTLRKYSSMQELNRDFDETDAFQGSSQRLTWHEETMPRTDNEYDFDDDYRVLEQQYRNDDAAGYFGAAQLPRNPSYQNSIPESLNESEEETDNSPSGGAETEVGNKTKEPVKIAPSNEKKSPAKTEQKIAKRNERGARVGKPDEVSEMRGYSTLPRSRGQKVVQVSQQEYGGTLPRSSRRSRSNRQRSNEV